MNIIQKAIWKLQGKAIPSEIIVYPQVKRLKLTVQLKDGVKRNIYITTKDIVNKLEPSIVDDIIEWYDSDTSPTFRVYLDDESMVLLVRDMIEYMYTEVKILYDDRYQ